MNYVAMYNSLNEFPWSPIKFFTRYYMEWGIGIIAFPLNMISMPVEVFFILVSLLTFIVIINGSRLLNLSALNVLPFYLPTFFLFHQLMQIHQGLSVALAYWVIAIIGSRRVVNFKVILLTFIAWSFHVGSASKPQGTVQ